MMKRKKLIYFLIFIFIIQTNKVIAETKYLYDILKNETISNGNAKEYSGPHKDSFLENPEKAIYHWYANNDSIATQVQEKNNILFANTCWKIIRTTDTGGIKLVYNGEANDNKCLNNRPTHSGYDGTYELSLTGTYWFGTDYTYNSSTKKYTVSGTTEYKKWNDSTADSLIGKYTCKTGLANGTCSTLYLINSYIDNTNALALKLGTSSHYSQIGKLPINHKSNSLAYSGYMYNTVYENNIKPIIYFNYLLNEYEPYGDYYYSDSYEWIPEYQEYRLTGQQKLATEDDYTKLIGKFTLFADIEDYTDASIFYVTNVVDGMIYGLRFGNGSEFEGANLRLIYGTSFTNNGNGTYTINDYTPIEPKNWYTTYQNVGANKYICESFMGNTCTNLWYIKEVNKYGFSYVKYNNNIKYANSFTYDNSTNTYTLSNQSFTTWNFANEDNLNALNNNHYTCWNESGTCTSISYIYYFGNNTSYAKNFYYINLKNGKNIEEAINEMLNINNVNSKDSIIKFGIEAWYKKYLLEYDDYLEDFIMCNDRTITNLSQSGWNPNNGDITKNINFKPSINSSLACTNTLYMFSTNNNQAKMKYKVGLLNNGELELLKSSSLRKTGQNYWISAPTNTAFEKISSFYISNSGSLGGMNLDYSQGVRASISLKPNTRILSGNGSTSNPYTIDTNTYYSINIAEKEETDNININIDDLETLTGGENISFSITPVKGYKLKNIKITDNNNSNVDYTINQNTYSLTMPASNITITPEYEKLKYKITIENNNHTKEIITNIEDIKKVEFKNSVKLKVIPKEGYILTDLSISDEDNNPITYDKNEDEYSFTMPASNLEIKPTYEKVKRSITIISDDPNGTITIDLDNLNEVSYDDKISINTKPNEGYKLSKLLIIDELDNIINYKKDKDNKYTFNMPANNVIVKPIYEIIKSSITIINEDSNGTISLDIDNPNEVSYEDEVKVIVTPKKGYKLISITITDESNNNIEYIKEEDNTYIFIMPDNNVTIKPTYQIIVDNNPTTSDNKITNIILVNIITLFILSFLYIKKFKN